VGFAELPSETVDRGPGGGTVSARERAEEARAQAFLDMQRKLVSFVGRRVKVWTRFLETPVRGTLVYVSPVPPYVLIVSVEGKPVVVNWHESVMVESEEAFQVP